MIESGRWVLAFALVVAVAACSSDSMSEATTPASTSSVPSTSSSAPTTTDPSTSSPDAGGSARERLDWVLSLLNGGPVDQATVEAGFAADFLAQVPYTQLVETVASIVGADTGWSVADASGLVADGGTATIRSASGTEIEVELHVEAAEPHRISGLFMAPVIPEPFAPGETVSADAITTKLGELGHEHAFGVFDVSDGTCRLVAGDGPDRSMPLGSTFKLWVLGAVALAVADGRLAWDQQVTISDALESSSDGEASKLADGSTATVRRLAEWMISISDNTATDHLIALVGRESVEAAMVAAEVADPAANVPLPSTREFFLLKWGDADRRERYLAGDAAARRAILDTELAGVSLIGGLGATFVPPGPTLVDRIEWFATPADQCHTQVWLAQLASQPGLEPVADILSVNPGIPFADRWTDVRFKGGSEPGVVFASWRVADASGAAYVIAGGVYDPTAPVSDVSAIVTLAAAADLPGL